MNRLAIAVAGALLGAAGFAQSAGAVALVQTSGPGSYPSLTVGGETITETSCTSALCSFLNIALDAAGTGFTITGTNGLNGASGTSIMQSSGSAMDLSLSFAVTGAQSITQVGLSMISNITLTQGSLNNNDISVGESVHSGASALTIPTYTAGSTGEHFVTLPPGQTNIDIDLNKDIQINPSRGANGVWTVSSVTEDFVYGVPEPMSAALLGVGVLAALRVRQQRRRR